jgi:hypothetical protein
MRSLIVIVAAGMIIGLPIAALDGMLPKSAIPFNGDALRTAIADGMSRAGATVVHAETGAHERRP